MVVVAPPCRDHVSCTSDVQLCYLMGRSFASIVLAALRLHRDCSKGPRELGWFWLVGWQLNRYFVVRSSFLHSGHSSYKHNSLHFCTVGGVLFSWANVLHAGQVIVIILMRGLTSFFHVCTDLTVPLGCSKWHDAGTKGEQYLVLTCGVLSHIGSADLQFDWTESTSLEIPCNFTVLSGNSNRRWISSISSAVWWDS